MVFVPAVRVPVGFVSGGARLYQVRGSAKPALCTVDRASRAMRALPP